MNTDEEPAAFEVCVLILLLLLLAGLAGYIADMAGLIDLNQIV